MNTYLLADQILQYALNALIAFLLFAFLTEGVIRLFKLGSGRLRAFLRLIPPARLFMEPFMLLSGFFALPFNASIFSCSHPFQYFLYGLLPVETRAEMEVYQLKTVTGALLLRLPESLLFTAIMLAAGMGVFRLSCAILHYARSVKRVRQIQKKGEPLTGLVGKGKLLDQLVFTQTEIISSFEAAVPFAGWGNVIVVPASFDKVFSREEIGAVIAHELEHLRCHDNVSRLFYHLVSSVHWWVPMSAWFGRLEHDQEIACDSAIFKYGLKGISLATALKKSVERNCPRQLLCAAFLPAGANRPQSVFMERIRTVLDEAAGCRPNRVYAFAGCALLLVFIFMLGFTIC